VEGVLAGLAMIGIIIGLGFLLAQLNILDASAQAVLTRGGLLCRQSGTHDHCMGGTDVHRLLSANLIASLGSVAVSTMITVLLAGCSGTENLARRSSRRFARPTSTLATWSADRRVRPGRCGANRANAAPPIDHPATDRSGGAGCDHPCTEPRHLSAPAVDHPPQPAASQPAGGRLVDRIRPRSNGHQTPNDHQRPINAGRRNGSASHAAGVPHLTPSRTATERGRATNPSRHTRLAQAHRATRHRVRDRRVRGRPDRS
jgi:hypothetical protein